MVVYSEFFVGQTRVRLIYERPEGFDKVLATGMDFYPPRSSGIHQTGVDAGDFVADLPG